jgi:ribosomal protein S18 acetylase RimI-like enzyme
MEHHVSDQAIPHRDAVIVIRLYQPGDDAGCRACVVELQDSERRFDERLRTGESIVDTYLAQMHVHCRGYAGAIFVADRDGEIVGLVMVLARVPFEQLDQPPGHFALVAELVVRYGYRRAGIATALLDTAARYARDAGATELSIIVLSENAPARRLYLREGFAPYKETLTKSLGVSLRGS